MIEKCHQGTHKFISVFKHGICPSKYGKYCFGCNKTSYDYVRRKLYAKKGVVLIDTFKNIFIGNIIFLLLINCLLFGPSLDNWKTNQDKQQKILYNQSIIIVMSKLKNIILRYSEDTTPPQFNNNTGVVVVNFECKEFLWNISKLKLILFLQPTLLNLPHFY